jgi:hypothetical protein
MPVRNRALLKRGQRYCRKSLLLATGQTTQYSSELDDGYYKKGIVKSYTIRTTGQFSGNAVIDLIHLASDTGAFVSATKTYTDVGKCGVFKAAGGDPTTEHLLRQVQLLILLWSCKRLQMKPMRQ